MRQWDFILQNSCVLTDTLVILSIADNEVNFGLGNERQQANAIEFTTLAKIIPEIVLLNRFDYVRGGQSIAPRAGSGPRARFCGLRKVFRM